MFPEQFLTEAGRQREAVVAADQRMVIRCSRDDLAGFVHDVPPPIQRAGLVDAPFWRHHEGGTRKLDAAKHLKGMAYHEAARAVVAYRQTTMYANGLTFDDVFKCTVMLAHMFNWGAFNQIYVTFYAGEFSGELRGWSNFSSRVHPARFLSMPLTIRNAGDTPDQIAFWQAQSRHDGRQLRFLLLRRAPKSSGRRPLGWSTGCGRPVAPRLKLR